MVKRRLPQLSMIVALKIMKKLQKIGTTTTVLSFPLLVCYSLLYPAFLLPPASMAVEVGLVYVAVGGVVRS
jgi:hypothetical protein